MSAEPAGDGASGPSLSHRTAVGASWMIAWRMVTRTLGMGSVLVLARLLLPGDFGLVAMATMFTAAIDTLSDMGITDALVRRPANDRPMMDTAFTLQLIRGVLSGAIILAAAVPVSHWFHEPRLLPVVLVLGGTAMLGGFENIGVAEFRHGLRFDQEFKLRLLPRLAGVVVTIAAALLYRSYWALIAGIVTGQVSRLLMTYTLHPYRPRLSLRRWRDLVGFSAWSWAGSLASIVWERGDFLVYGPILGPATLGVYMLGHEMGVLPITELVAPATTALFSGVSRAQDRGEDPNAMALPVALTLVLVTVPLAIGISATSGYVVAGLLGAKWNAARPLIAIFATLCAFSPVSFVCTSVLRASNHVRRSFYAIALTALTKIVVLVVMSSVTHRVELYAWSGVGLTVAEACFFLWQLNAARRIEWRPALWPVCRILGASAVTLAALSVSGLGWQPTALTGFAALGVGIPLGLGTVAIFVAVDLLFWWSGGRPWGPEARLLGMASPALRKLRLRAL